MRLPLPVLVLVLVAGCREAKPNPEAAMAAVTAANAAKDEAMIARDAGRLADFYTEDYLLIDDKAALHDKPDQVEFMTKNVELLEAKSDDVRVTMLAPDAALLTGRMTGRYRMDDKESAFTERYTGVWRRTARGWQVKHEHGSLVPQPE